MKKLFILLPLLMFTPLWGDHHPSIEWERINTEHFNIVFDSRIENDAQYIANKLENYHDSILKGMGDNIDRYTILLSAESLESNGFVAYVNNSSTFYSTPSLNNFAGAVSWYDLLSIHETRHMAQMSNYRNSRLQRVLEVLTGSYGIIYTLIPAGYFWEGDAVLTETLLTDGGRGRSPDFEMGLRTKLLSDENYSLSKAWLGSGKDYIPNYYKLGYFLMTYIRREYGYNALEDIIRDTGNNPLPLQLSNAVKSRTGEWMPVVYDNAMKELKTLWQEQDSKVKPTAANLLFDSDLSEYHSFKRPYIDTSGRVFYIESSVGYYNRLVMVDGEDQRVVDEIDGRFSVSDNSVIYSKTWNDPRWTFREYSDIYRYDIESDKHERITKKGRYLNPVYSTDGRRIAALKYNEDRTIEVVIFSSADGSILESKKLDDFEMISDISWSEDDKKLLFTTLNSEGIGIALYDTESGSYSYVAEADNVEKSSPKFYGSSVIYQSSYSGIKDIHLIRDREEYRIVSSRFGADYPSVTGDRLIFSDYTVDGYKIKTLDLNNLELEDFDKIERLHVDYFEPLLEKVVSPEDNNIEYEVKNYNPMLNSVDIHSWLLNPLVPVVEKSEIYDSTTDEIFNVMEFILYSNDHLGTSEVTLYGHYHTENEELDFGGYGTYSGFYPKLGWDFNFYMENPEEGVSDMDLSLDTGVPLNFGYHTITPGLIPDLDYSVDNSDDTDFNITYYLSYDFADNYKSFSPTVILYQGIAGEEYLAIGGSLEADTEVFSTRDILSLSSTFFSRIDSSTTISSGLVTQPDGAILDLPLFYSPLLTYNNLSYTYTFLYPDLNVFNWVYFNKFNLAAGYESLYADNRDYEHLVSFTLSIDYYLLRMPIQFSSNLYGYYDIDEGYFDFGFNAIMALD